MTAKAPTSNRALAEVVDRLARVPQSEAFAGGLNPAQWSALRYFDRANRFSRTVTAFARYHGTTQGTASQTVKALVGKGLLRRRRDRADRRSSLVEPTERGRRALERDPLRAIEAAADAIGTAERARLAEGLAAMLGRLVEECAVPAFGVCRECRHLGETCRRGRAAEPRCALFDQSLAPVEVERLCMNFAPRAVVP